jgi:type I restriction-modification system DNA methylase subunit
MITKQALGSTLFGMADILRDKVEDYKAYIFSLLFFKRLSDGSGGFFINAARYCKENYGSQKK